MRAVHRAAGVDLESLRSDTPFAETLRAHERTPSLAERLRAAVAVRRPLAA